MVISWSVNISFWQDFVTLFQTLLYCAPSHVEFAELVQKLRKNCLLSGHLLFITQDRYFVHLLQYHRHLWGLAHGQPYHHFWPHWYKLQREERLHCSPPGERKTRWKLNMKWIQKTKFMIPFLSDPIPVLTVLLALLEEWQNLNMV